MKLWSFKTKNFTVIWEIERDVLDTRYMDKECAEECRRNVASGKWKCFASTVKVIENSTKITLGAAYLGMSIYEKPEEFRDHFGMNANGHGSYFSDMVREAISEARKALPAHQARIKKEILKKQKVLSITLRSTEDSV